MKYSVRVFQCDSVGWLSWPAKVLIKLITKKDYSHYAMAVHSPINGGECFVYEATWPKSKKTPFLEWFKKHEIKKIYTLEADDDPAIFLEALVGMKYSIWQLCLIYLQIVLNSVGIEIKFLKGNGSKLLICSEFVALYLVNYEDVVFDEISDTLGLDEVEKELDKLTSI